MRTMTLFEFIIAFFVRKENFKLFLSLFRGRKSNSLLNIIYFPRSHAIILARIIIVLFKQLRCKDKENVFLTRYLSYWRTHQENLFCICFSASHDIKPLSPPIPPAPIPLFNPLDVERGKIDALSAEQNSTNENRGNPYRKSANGRD